MSLAWILSFGRVVLCSDLLTRREPKLFVVELL